jgi:hypothetical protein
VTRARVILLVLLVRLTGVVFLADLLVIPGRIPPATPYAIPVLIASAVLSPGMVALVAAVAVSAQVAGSLIEHASPDVWPLSTLSLVLVGTSPPHSRPNRAPKPRSPCIGPKHSPGCSQHAPRPKSGWLRPTGGESGSIRRWARARLLPSRCHLPEDTALRRRISLSERRRSLA